MNAYITLHVDSDDTVTAYVQNGHESRAVQATCLKCSSPPGEPVRTVNASVVPRYTFSHEQVFCGVSLRAPINPEKTIVTVLAGLNFPVGCFVSRSTLYFPIDDDWTGCNISTSLEWEWDTWLKRERRRSRD